MNNNMAKYSGFSGVELRGSGLGVRSELTATPVGADCHSGRSWLRVRILLTLFLLTIAVSGAWGQDYSGTYYIASCAKSENNGSDYTYDSNQPENNFYLCPTKGWIYYQSSPPYYNNTTPGQPFLTTFKCRSGATDPTTEQPYDEREAKWTLIKHSEQDCYYIRRNIDGKYLTLNGTLGNSAGGYSALVRGNTTVTVQGNAKVEKNVYGGGEIASVGKYRLDAFQMPSYLDGGGGCTVTIKGYAEVTGNVFGAGKGVTPDYNYNPGDKDEWSKRMMDYSAAYVNGKTEGTDWDYCDNHDFIWDYFTTPAAYSSYLETLALATKPDVTIDGNALVNNDVYGGGERGLTKGGVTVTVNGGAIGNDVYGGGALAHTNLANWVQNETTHEWEWLDDEKSAKHTTTVNLHGGTIGHNVYGGGLGSKPTDIAPDIPALVYGDVLVELNRNTASDNCVVKGAVHGCNNYNGSPKGDVTVHINKTQGWEEPKLDEDGHQVYEEDGETPAMISHDVSAGKADENVEKTNTVFELKAVYGGGNEAAYEPIDDSKVPHVIIDGCDLTSIETVYGGGNAAPVTGTHVTVNSCYEIGTVFGGGNGLDNMDDGTPNPGADVGLIALKTGGIPYEGDATKQAYGSGNAYVELLGGTIHTAFGGSNTLGNVRTKATVDLNEPDVVTCPLEIDEVYGAGNEAEQDGSSEILLGCLAYLKEI